MNFGECNYLSNSNVEKFVKFRVFHEPKIRVIDFCGGLFYYKFLYQELPCANPSHEGSKLLIHRSRNRNCFNIKSYKGVEQ